MQHCLCIEVMFWRNAFSPSSERMLLNDLWYLRYLKIWCKLTRDWWTLTKRWVTFKTKDLADGEGQPLTGDCTRGQRKVSTTGRSFDGWFVQYTNWHNSGSHCTHQEKLLNSVVRVNTKQIWSFSVFNYDLYFCSCQSLNKAVRQRNEANSRISEERTKQKSDLRAD